ncbi:unnamed protein product [Lymnaea stagnalis]|uniref:Tetraspanin n=1 Tax=Lymnaea stagnalis TaxID=6523 RepID=A0AAV2IFC4_LYMST
MAVYGCCHRFMKYVLVILNFLVLCAGAIAIGLGAWSLASEYGAKEMKAITGSELYQGGCIVIIVGGSIICLLALCGCLGAFLENRVLLGIYFVIMLLILILFVVGSTLGFFYRDTLKQEVAKQMEDTLKNNYQVNYNSDDKNKLTTDVWDKIQKELYCCGVSGNRTSEKSWYLYQSSKFFLNQNGTDKDYVPRSCCNEKLVSVTKIYGECQKRNPLNNMAIQVSLTLITQDNPALYEDGCIDAVEDKIMEHIVAIAGIALAVLIIMVIAIIFSVCVCMDIGRNKKEHAI